MKEFLRSFWSDEAGQGLPEYGLILALMSLGLIMVLVLFRDAIGSVFDKLGVALAVDPKA